MQATIEEQAQLLTVEEFARLSGISPWTVRAHCTRGSLKPVKIGRLTRLTRSQLVEVQTRGLPSLREAEASG